MSTSEAVKVKSKNLNVKEEYEKSQQKNAASFIVIGMDNISFSGVYC